ncbi:MAG: HlyD family efflux transporter periplasmic adaptor subunit, partial [Spirochaetales bacterium]|nr:HlyD family efflux transporter periplasmic adaptor subunit [Spirochaetales bacterium]
TFPFDVLGLRLETGFDTETSLAVIAVQNTNRAEAGNLLDRLQMLSDVPASYQLQRVTTEATSRVEHFAGVLDLMALINEQKRFLATLMTFCNELAFRQNCERVSIGWMENSYIRLRAISHVDRFDKKSEAVQRLEQTMEEAFDQNAEIVYPNIHSGVVYREHQNYSRTYDVTNVCSVPIRVDDKPVAVATFERNSEPFTELELRLLRLACDQTARRLSDLRMKDRWIGARIARGIRDGLGKIVGYEHTWAKVIGVGVAAAIGLLIFSDMEYRVKAPVILRTDDVAYITAPFAGHIDQVNVRVGDEVSMGDELLNLDDKNLHLQRAALTAEQSQYTREYEKARAQNELAEMRINQARRDQAAARLALLDYHLSQSVLLAPFDGIIVEGDLRERLGAPVEQGEMLFKLARVDKLYAELEIDEADIHEISISQAAQMALAASPQLNFPMTVFRIEPVAEAKEKGNVFIIHCSFPEGVKDWWRPGMTGVAKISAGKRGILWVLTHRTIDFFSMRLWW